jgi:hypothetical protein
MHCDAHLDGKAEVEHQVSLQGQRRIRRKSFDAASRSGPSKRQQRVMLATAATRYSTQVHHIVHPALYVWSCLPVLHCDAHLDSQAEVQHQVPLLPWQCATCNWLLQRCSCR